LLNRLGTEFETLHMSHQVLRASSKGGQSSVESKPINPNPVLPSPLPCPLLGDVGLQAPEATEEADVQTQSPSAASPQESPMACDVAIHLHDIWDNKAVKTSVKSSVRDDQVVGKRGTRSGFDSETALIAMFEELDTDGLGTLSSSELRRALLLAGVPQARLGKIIGLADTDDSGTIDLDEWIRAVRSDAPDMLQLSRGLQATHMLDGTLLETSRRNVCIIHPLSTGRMVWDFFMSLVCIYIALGMPFYIAWEAVLSTDTTSQLEIWDRWFNNMFILDVFLNFRTGYMKDNDLVMDWKKIAKNYLRTWFLLDAVSSLPTDEIQAGQVNSLQVIRVLKFSKLLKLVKLMKPRNVVEHLSEKSDIVYDFAQAKVVQLMRRNSRVLFYMLLLSHWMACGMKLVDSNWLSSYQNVGGNLWPEYMAAIYWAMTTLTTVGYGDITPSSDAERAYSTVMMIIGGSFYGYVVGAISSVVSGMDLNAEAYNQRMDLISAWLDHHSFPMKKKRTLHRYFKHYLSKKSAISETQVFEDLPHELQKEAGEYIIHENVKHNPIFDGLGIGCVVQLQSILRKVTLEYGACIATRGEVGIAMYIVFLGSLEMLGGDADEELHDDALEKTRSREQARRSQSRLIVPGQSFGEELLLGLAEHYEYTVKATEKCELEMIRQDEFLKVFSLFPNALERMRENTLEMKPQLRRTEHGLHEDRATFHTLNPSHSVIPRTSPSGLCLEGSCIMDNPEEVPRAQLHHAQRAFETLEEEEEVEM